METHGEQRRLAQLRSAATSRWRALAAQRTSAAPAPAPGEPTWTSPAADADYSDRDGETVEPSRHPVPWLLRATAAWSWRLVVVALAVWVVLDIISRLWLLVLALIAALLSTALVYPVFRALLRTGFGRGGAAGFTVLGLILTIAGAVTFVSATTIDELPALQESIGTAITQIRDWLINGPIHLNDERLESLSDELLNQLQQNQERLTSGAIVGATIALEVLAGLALSLFATFFFLYDGPRIWGWLVRLFTPRVRARVDGAGAVAWQTLTGYIRGTTLVAFVDAVFIGLGLVIVGVPLAVPLAVLTFFGAFIPIAGATLAGAAAVLVALVSKGFVSALIILGVVLLVQQVEGHVLQPLVLGRSTRLHPLAIVVSITAGATLAGIPGALIAVPLVAVINRVAVHLNAQRTAAIAGHAPPVDGAPPPSAGASPPPSPPLADHPSPSSDPPPADPPPAAPPADDPPP